MNRIVVFICCWQLKVKYQVSFFISSYSCVAGADKIKHENTLDLFAEIDPKVCFLSLSHSCSSTMCCICFKTFIKLFLFLSGIQTQTHWQVRVVLFTKSRGWESMATTHQRQAKGNFLPLKDLWIHRYLSTFRFRFVA